MTFRTARHTTSLKPIIDFYTQNLGLEILGSFENHQQYDGVFLGKKDANWHLEFTVSNELPQHRADEDDLLVFYIENELEFIRILSQFEQNGIYPVSPKNPYWNNNAKTYIDPDGFRIVVTLKQS